MPTCQNCGSAVSKEYVRVFSLPSQESVRCCPNCDLLREGTSVRESRGSGSSGSSTGT
ncbi:hypothetical protein SAMN04487950_4238 [Halogranum rubrum]|uniref:Small CPxCG-related zinc finger protein n=1 Tax=Halogranum rubrum TaxID=553466 RepID=A0A1I4IQG0_9EURY|nr:hypothetical protein [Halogranum rubrum]SFL56525.1 hypothetical protein SAMN04487950_4238 [Halogranum rubrum]